MKKLILSSAAVLFISLTAFSQQAGNCTPKCDKKYVQNVCIKDCSSTKKWSLTDLYDDKKCAQKESAKVCSTNKQWSLNDFSAGNGCNGQIAYNKKSAGKMDSKTRSAK